MIYIFTYLYIIKNIHDDQVIRAKNTAFMLFILYEFLFFPRFSNISSPFCTPLHSSSASNIPILSFLYCCLSHWATPSFWLASTRCTVRGCIDPWGFSYLWANTASRRLLVRNLSSQQLQVCFLKGQLHRVRSFAVAVDFMRGCGFWSWREWFMCTQQSNTARINMYVIDASRVDASIT